MCIRDSIRTEISTVESFDSTNVSFIPFSPHINYYNSLFFNDSISNINEIDFRIIKRNKSQTNLPSENNSLKVNNFFTINNITENFNIYNKLSILNNISDYTFEHDVDLNRSDRFHHLILSSDIYYNYFDNITPRIKIIHNNDIYESDNIINEDSDSLTFGYQNQYKI